MDYVTEYPSPVGVLTLASDGAALTGLWLEGQKFFAQGLDSPNAAEDLPVFAEAKAWLADYFAGSRPSPDRLPLAPRGSEFRQAVWQILLTIPYGQTMTYGQIAHQIAAARGRAVSAQAVGGAVGHNPISIIIPCHRVLGSDGSLTGYAGGLEKKNWLLKHEEIAVNSIT